MTYDIAIIGAGPAGLMAACQAATSGAKVIVLEKNSQPGLKLLMTGKERCNITNSLNDSRQFSEQFGRNGRFLLSAFSCLGVQETIDFFHEHHVKTKIERGGRIFPVSDRSRDVLDLFLNLLKQLKVQLVLDCEIKKIVSDENKIVKTLSNDKEIKARSYVFCTGGLSYPKTGCTGDGYRWAKDLGHAINKTIPSLTPVIVQEKWVKDLKGLSLKNVHVSIYQNNKKHDSRFGEALFTDNGLSGPIILDMSKNIGELLSNAEVKLKIDYKPALDYKKLDQKILRDFQANPHKNMKNYLRTLLPQKLIPVMIKLLNISDDKKCQHITKTERKKLIQLLKEFTLTVKELVGFKKAIITSGGVSLKEIDPNTMKSKLIDNLYFAGEIIDLDAPTGGYNLQLCWSTGCLAGKSAAKV